MSMITDQIQRELAGPQAEPLKLNGILRLLAKYRCSLLQAEVIRKYGTDVQGGPFKGMHFIEQSAEGCHIPKLLGCYEQELHGFISSIGERKYDALLNIGCAEGYYAVGFKRLYPDCTVIACDTNARAQNACAELAKRNGVEVEISGTFTPDDFSKFPGRTLVWCDIEGAERDLLDPAGAPALKAMDIVVELHPTRDAPDLALIPGRFAATHDIHLVWPRVGRTDLPDMFRSFGHLDQLLAIWEWRSTPTPWAIMIAKQR